jgi:phosphoribosylanthranilate isomerase
MTKIKICGITNEADAEAAVAAGADALGFILYPKSPRYVAPERIAAIVATLPPGILTMAVTVNPTVEEIAALRVAVPFTHWQFHGQETPHLLDSFGLPPERMIKALHLPWIGEAAALEAHGVGTFLLDTPSPAHGGTGRTFDWNLVAAFRELTVRPFFLSGGLGVDNVAEAVRRVQPYGVDVSSGVERTPGRKDPQKIRDFIDRCRQAQA